jgi:hypothetical protein
MADEQESLIPCTWKAKGRAELGIPVIEIRETYATGIVKRRRVYKHGAKLDDTGEDAISWELDAIWFNGSSDPSAAGAEDEQYPQGVDTFTDACRVHETGDLTLATRGPRRARLVNYRRVDSASVRNGCTVTMLFVEDSEDDITAASFSAPSAGVASRSIVEAAGEFCEAAGASPSLLSQLKDLAGELEGLAQAPGEFVDSLEAQANAIVGTVSRIERAFADTRNKAGGELVRLMTDPTNAAALRSLRKLSDVAKRAVGEAAESGAVATRVISKSYTTELSIFDVAAREGQSVKKLLSMNGAIPNMLAIAPGTVVKLIDNG